jgi:hypothetical protein
MRLQTIVFAIVLAVGMPAFAQKVSENCSRSCSEVVQGCIGMGGRGCSDDLANCLKTGRLHMPSGRTVANLCKK